MIHKRPTLVPFVQLCILNCCSSCFYLQAILKKLFATFSLANFCYFQLDFCYLKLLGSPFLHLFFLASFLSLVAFSQWLVLASPLLTLTSSQPFATFEIQLIYFYSQSLPSVLVILANVLLPVSQTFAIFSYFFSLMLSFCFLA